MRKRVLKKLVCDFETTVFEGQTSTEVWASAIVEMGTEDVVILGSIDDTFEYFKQMNCDIIAYYHNLKFDGAFWLSYLLTDLHYETFLEPLGDGITMGDKKRLQKNQVIYSISSMGQWYTIAFKIGSHYIELRDSLKLLPFSVKQIGESFGTKHKKLEMEYKGFRYANCPISEEEYKYIENDVLVVKEALEIMFEQGHDALTIGSCCLQEYKRLRGIFDYNILFPDMYDIPLDEEIYGSPNAGEYIRKSYKGGWCYLVKGKECTEFHGGTTADVNSLYPSMMHSQSGNRYPVNKPTFWKGNFIPEKALENDNYYFIRIKTRFYLKENKLPCIQLKHNFLYKQNEWLESSDVFYKGNRYERLLDDEGNEIELIPEMTLTVTDFQLIQEQYELVDLEILDGCWFETMKGIFDDYINKYKKIKMESTGAMRTLAKLFLNNLYGKMAANQDSSFKVASVDPDLKLHFDPIKESNKKPGYIPVGSAITSYARNFTIRAAQANYYGKDKRGFIYADTDSIHCDLSPDKMKGIVTHPSEFCCWKLESCWDIGYFTRQKTYIEHVTHEDEKPVEKPYYNVKCAGMPDKCKNLFVRSMEHRPLTDEERDKYTAEEIEVIEQNYSIKDFKIGLKLPGKLLPKRILGGIVLTETTYEMR